MLRIVLALAAVAAAALALAASGLARGHKAPTLVGTVGPGFTITLEQNGKTVKTLKAGTYRFVIHDKATIHAFSLDGPKGLAKDLTTVPFTGTKTVTLKLAPGAYKYYCPPHEPTMFGRFTVK
jgi:plastocyanin